MTTTSTKQNDSSLREFCCRMFLQACPMFFATPEHLYEMVSERNNTVFAKEIMSMLIEKKAFDAKLFNALCDYAEKGIPVSQSLNDESG